MAASSNYEATFTQAGIPGTSARRHIHVPAFARFEVMLNRLEKASALTRAPPRLRCDSTSRSLPLRWLSLVASGMAERIPARTERIAHCRNRYLEELRNNARYASADYVMVADLDGVNNDLRREAVETCWRTDVPWDVVTANQRDAYYDIWALRHPDWCPVDCHSQYARLRELFERPRALAIAIHSRMVRLSPRAAWIEVDSAFGGLAIYRREALLAGNYSGEQAGQSVCEHVPLHAQLRAQGFRIFINPALINAHRTDHSARIRLHVRLRREIEAFGKRLRDRWRG